MTAGYLDPRGVLSTVNPAEQRICEPRVWALISGIAGLLANVLLVFFFLLARPFSDVQNSFGWLGTAHDAVLVVQFGAMIPVALALRHWFPRTRLARVTTAMAVRAMLAVVVLQLLLIAGVLDFDVQVLFVVAAFLLVYAWMFIVSALGHRHGTLPRPATTAWCELSGRAGDHRRGPPSRLGIRTFTHVGDARPFRRQPELVGPSDLAVAAGPPRLSYIRIAELQKRGLL